MTTDPNELITDWRKEYERAVAEGRQAAKDGDTELTARSIGEQDALAACLNMLSSALAWHHMTDEPKGGDGVLVLITDAIGDTVVVESSTFGWRSIELIPYHARPFSTWDAVATHTGNNATWCYLPRMEE